MQQKFLFGVNLTSTAMYVLYFREWDRLLMLYHCGLLNPLICGTQRMSLSLSHSSQLPLAPQEGMGCKVPLPSTLEFWLAGSHAGSTELP